MIFNKGGENLSDYISLSKEIDSHKNKDGSAKKIKIAFLSSFTIQGLKEVLNVKCYNLGIKPDFYLPEYSQYRQEILNTESGLYQFNPDIIFILIDAMDLLGEDYFFPYNLSGENRKVLADEKLGGIISLINKLSNNFRGKIIINNFSVPDYSVMGILENKQEFGFKKMISYINDNLEKEFEKNSQVFVFDYESFCSRHGKKNIFSSKLYYLGDIKINFDFMPVLGNAYLDYIIPYASLTKKCLVLDLDNILWGGVVGEDGINGIKLGPTPQGKPFFEFQKYILSLFNRGVILAINSKNNLNDALEVIRNHPYMVLKEENFASMKINWNDKISNMNQISEELNIGTDSFVFIDDDPLNREMIRKTFPEMYVPDLPLDSSQYVSLIKDVGFFNTFALTKEDLKKGKIYADNKKRESLKESYKDLTEFLKELKTKVEIIKADDFTIPRISQLTQKTNQFNMTTRRYTEEDIRKFSSDKNYEILCIKVSDKFGDNGITGVAIIKKLKNELVIDTFLLSCRILGREIERAFMHHIIKQAKIENIEKLTGEFIQTEKNAPAKDFYKNNGFILSDKIDDLEKWKLNVKDSNYKCPEFIKIKELNG